MSWNGRTVLVTGAEGFIGSHLTEQLVELGADVRALVQYNSLGSWGWLDESAAKPEIDVHLADVRDRDSLRKPMAGVDTVFHLAALIAIPYSYEAPMSYVQTNVEGTMNVFGQALAEGVRLVVHTSTSEVYGTARHVPIDEAHPLQGQSPYSASKIAADKMAEAFHATYGLPVATLRPFNTYGPRQSARAVIPTIATQVLAGETVELGSLTPTRDFTYVSDTAAAFVAIADCPAAVGEVVNTGSGEEISIAELAALIAEIVHKTPEVRSVEARQRPPLSEVERLCADASKARTLLGWEPRHSLRDGLGLTIEWIGRNIERYRVGAYTV